MRACLFRELALRLCVLLALADDLEEAEVVSEHGVRVLEVLVSGLRRLLVLVRLAGQRQAAHACRVRTEGGSAEWREEGGKE